MIQCHNIIHLQYFKNIHLSENTDNLQKCDIYDNSDGPKKVIYTSTNLYSLKLHKSTVEIKHNILGSDINSGE